MRRGPSVLHVASLVAGVSLGLGCAAATAVSPEDRPSLARAVAASALRLDAGRRDLLVDAACTAGTARH